MSDSLSPIEQDARLVVRALVVRAHPAARLAQITGLPRWRINSAINWLKRRNLIEFKGPWRLTALGLRVTAALARHSAHNGSSEEGRSLFLSLRPNAVAKPPPQKPD